MLRLPDNLESSAADISALMSGFFIFRIPFQSFLPGSSRIVSVVPVSGGRNLARPGRDSTRPLHLACRILRPEFDHDLKSVLIRQSDFPMARSEKSLRICEKGHRYYKSSECPTCPVCSEDSRPTDGFLSRLSSPARSALQHYLGIDSLEKLSTYSEKEILSLHGIGKASMPVLREALAEEGLSFREKNE